MKIRDLEFGNLLAGSTAGTVALNAFTGVRTTTGGTVAVGGLFQRAEFITYGGPSALVVIFVGAAPVLTRVGGGATMTVSGLGYNGPLLRNLTTAGLIEMQVGGTLAVAANQMPGRYVGTFDLNVFYF